MDRQEYIDYLVDQGYSEEEIVKALQSRDFTKIETDPPKKTTDPLKQETSTGSTLDDMVSNLGDFSSESPTTNMYGFELSEEDIKSINRTDEEKAMDFALSTNPKYQELNSQLKEIQASKVLSPMAKGTQAKSIEKEIKKVKYYLGHKEASAYRALQQEEQVSPSSLLLKNTKYQNTKKALENIKTATKGDVTAITFVPEDEKIELQEDVENELIEQISKDEKKLDRYANYESTLALTGSIDSKENLITKAKSKALSNKINEVTEEFNNIDFSQMTKEEAENKYKELNGKVFQLQTEYDFNAAESVFYNNFKMTDEYEKYLNKEMKEGGFTDVARDAQATLLQELIKVPIKSTIGTGLALGNAITEVLEDVGIKEKTDDIYTGGDLMLDMFKKYISDANPLGVAKSEEFTFDFGDGFKAKNAAKTTAEMLPFIAGIYFTRGVRSTGTAASFGRFKLSTSRLAQMKAAARMTSIDSYFEGKEMGLSDGKAITYGLLKSTATGLVNGIMPDANLLGGSAGRNALVTLGKNLKSATNKAQIKAAANAFIVRPVGEIIEEEAELALGDLAKLSVGIKGKGELLKTESQSQTVAGTLLLTELLAPFGLSADLKNTKRAIYNAYREDGAGIIKQMQQEKKEAQLRMDRARTPERKAKWKELNDQYDKALEYASDLMLAINVSPESATPEELDLLREKQGLMRQKQGKDPLYTKRIDNQIKEIDNKLEQGEVAASRETIRTRTLDNVNKIIDDLNASTESNVLIESFEKDEELSATDKIKNKVKEIESQAESIPSDKDIEQSDAFVVEMKDGSSQVFINSDVSKETKAITAPQHELLHVVLKNTFKKNPELANQMKNSLEGFLDELSPSIAGEGGYISAVLENYKDQSVDIQSEEFLTALSDAMSKGFINSEIISETALDKLGNAIKSVVDKVIPNRRYKFNSGKDVFSFIKDFNKSVYKGEFSNKLKNTLEQGAVTTTDTEVDAERKVMASVSEKPKAIFMVGGPGAGKTNVGKGLKLGRRGFKVVNQDIALEAMKEEVGLPAEEAGYTAEQRSLRSKLGAAAVKAAKEKFNQYVSNKNDMVIDGTGASYNATMKKVKELEDAGFDVSMVVANTPLQTALDRNRARKERSLPDKIVTKTYDQVQESLAKYRQDFGKKLYEINTEAIRYGEDLPQDFLDEVYKGVGVEKRQPKYSKATVLEEINDLVPGSVTTKEDFANPRVFDKIYEATAMPGGVINNYIRSRTSSIEEAEAATDSVVDRLIAFDPQAKRADGSTVGIEGFGEFIFANTAFGKLDAKKKLFEESQRKAQETRIDESTKQIADVEEQVFTQEEVGIKEKPTINPLKFTGVPEDITLSKAPEGKPTFKTITKQYAGEVGEQAIGIPAKKITESAANLGSVNEARAIQQFFFKADNLDKFVKILPEFNIALPETQIGLETLDAPRDVKGTGLGLSKRILDYFYEDFIDPTGKLTSPKGRSKGLTSQVPVKRLKPEFRGIVTKETIDNIKSDIGITPKGELNILPKGELRSPIGQLLKGMAKTYSSLAANTLVRQEMGASNFAKEDIARAAAGKQRVMASRTSTKKIENVEDLSEVLMKEIATARDFKAVQKILKKVGFNIEEDIKDLDEFQLEIDDLVEKANLTPQELAIVKLYNFGVRTTYGKFENGVFKNISKSQLKQEGKNPADFKYFELKNNEFEKVPKDGAKSRAKQKELKDKLLPSRSDVYYGKDDPNAIRANEIASKNKSDSERIVKRVNINKAGTKEADLQFEVNIEVLENLMNKLTNAVHNKGASMQAATKLITKAYQATSGIIKISAPFNYYSKNPKHAGVLGKPEQRTGELFREEHTMPASAVGGYLIYALHSNAAKPIMQGVKNNFFQVKLGKNIDAILDYAGLGAKLAEGSSILDEHVGAIRMLEANIKTEDIDELDRLNMNDIISYKTGKSWAEELGVSLPKKLWTRENLDIQNRLLMDKIKGTNEYANHQQYLNEYTKIKDIEKVASNNVAKSPTVVVKASKSNKQVLNSLNNYDKALRNARNAKAPVKGISVFDFDDTLATSKSKVIVNMPASEVQKITGTGDATKIIRTVYDGAVSLISNKKEIKKLNFAADFSEPSRVKLYNTLAKKLEKELGWDLDVFEEFTFGKKTQEDFELTRPEGAKDVKPRDSDLEFTENEIGGFEASFNIDDKQYNVYVDFRGEGDYDLSFKLVEESETFEITPEEFAKRGEELLEQGAEFDFTQFSQVIDGKPGPLIAKLDKAIKKFGNKDVFVLTARPANSASAIYEFLKGLGYEIPLENITGLANSSPEAKAQWMVDKAAEGYNDFYFTDDAYKNVKAVQDAMRVLDVKSKERMVYKDRYDKLDKEMNDILEAKTGIAAEKEYSKAKAEVVGAGKGRFKFFIPPSADDFVGLLYSTLAKGKLGDNQMAWYKKNLIDPYARAMNNISSERVTLAADYKALKKQLGIVPKNLRKKIKGEGFTQEQAVRMYIWNKQDMNIPGLSKTDLADMVKFVEDNASLQVFADQLIEINKGDGYPAPKEYWLSGSITTDLMDGLGGTKRAKHLEEWQQNVDVIFSEKNLNKMEAAYGRPYREAMENMLERMKSGKNRNYNGDSTTGRMLDWLNGSIGAIMFLNTRSAVLQTLSAVNFINFKDNNILAAGKAFANQKQYWKDFKELFNSDFLKERREGMNINVNESDIADMAKRGGAKGAISYLLQLGFTPTQIADSFAIASGGATFYRNRIKTYIKAGMPEAQAKEKAFLDFRETAEESQQSSRPDRISKQQAGPLGRVVLAFANTPSQYARIIKKAGQDLAARRGSAVSNISKIIYYGAVQGFIFNAIQQALFAADMEDEEEMEEKYVRLANGMADGVLRGMGVSGAATAVVKNAGLRVYNESQKDRPKYEKVAFELTKLSPPISSKLSRINQAAREVQWNSDEMKQKGFSLDNPAWLAAGNVISATTNIPVDRAIKKVNNVKDAFDQDLAMYERIALLSGWQAWELGIDKKKKEKIENGEIKYEDIQYEDIEYEDIKLED